MYQPRHKRNSALLWTLLLIAGVYSGALFLWHRLTDIPRFDGSVGVLLGLFICSRGAANLLDIILYGRIAGRVGSRRSEIQWVALNVLVLVIGASLITIGTMQFVRVSGPGLNLTP